MALFSKKTNKKKTEGEANVLPAELRTSEEL